MVVLLASVTVGFAWTAAADTNKVGEPTYQSNDVIFSSSQLNSPVDQDDSNALFNRGENYRVGRRVERDFKEAAKWYRLAALKGHQRAQIRLGIFYHEGYGVSQDFIRAYMWFTIATSSENYEIAKAAKDKRDKIDPWMTSAELAHAQEMVRRCQQSKFTDCD